MGKIQKINEIDKFDKSLMEIVENNNNINTIIKNYIEGKQRNSKLIEQIKLEIIKNRGVEESENIQNRKDQKKLISFFLTIENSNNINKFIKKIRKSKKRRITISKIINEAIEYYSIAQDSLGEKV